MDRAIVSIRPMPAKPASLDAKVAVQLHIKALETRCNDMRKRLFEAQDNVEDRKDELLHAVEARLRQTVESGVAMEQDTSRRRYLDELERYLAICATFEDACSILQDLLTWPFSATEIGELYEINGLVSVTNGVKLTINLKEHAQPHFYSRSTGWTRHFGPPSLVDNRNFLMFDSIKSQV